MDTLTSYDSDSRTAQPATPVASACTECSAETVETSETAEALETSEAPGPEFTGTGAYAHYSEARLRQTFDAYVATEYTRLLRTARHLCSSADQAEDLVQDTLARFWKYFRNFDPKRGSFFTIGRIQLKHVFYDQNRYKRGQQKPLSIDDPNLPHDRALTTDGLHDSVLTNAAIRQTLERMPDDTEREMLDEILAGGNVQEYCRSHSYQPSTMYQALQAARDILNVIQTVQETKQIPVARTVTGEALLFSTPV
jgi:RNA polymerase sigma factor (sigma-70 family)